VEDREAYEKAKKRMEAKIGFYIHLAVYAGVNCSTHCHQPNHFTSIPLVQMAIVRMGDRPILPGDVYFCLLRQESGQTAIPYFSG